MARRVAATSLRPRKSTRHLVKGVFDKKRQLSHQTLERRELLAAGLGPQLISVSANSGENFRLAQGNTLTESPTQLTFRFDGSQQIDPATLAAITIERSGGDGVFGPNASGVSNDIRINPGFLGFGDSQRIVIARFAETLPDDQYRIRIAGYDDTNSGIVGLRNTEGDLFRPLGADSDSRPGQTIQFRVELGPQVVAVVPQPITGFGSTRTQKRDQIHVYFNEDPLSNPAAGELNTEESTAAVVQTRFYNLYLTGGTVENTDDLQFNPMRVDYNPALRRAVLTFAQDINDLVPGGAGTFRLRVGSSQALPAAPLPVDVDLQGNVGDTFQSAHNLGIAFDANPHSILISGEIEPTTDYPVQWPGVNSPGTRDQRRDPQVFGQPDSTPGINVYYYNFAQQYGIDPFDNVLDNAITPVQQQRTREILSLYAEHLGVQFIETENRGLQIVTGDLRALVRPAITGPGEALHEFRLNDEDPTQGVLILDSGEDWYDGYGLSPDPGNHPSWFVEALRGIGSLLGIGHTFEQVPGVASGSNPDLYNASMFPLPGGGLPSNFSIEPDFLSTSDIIPGQAMHRPESRDVDLYRFNVAADGRIAIETFAQRLDETSLLDTDIKLWKLNAVTGQYDLVSRNDDYYSNDSFIGVNVSPNADGTPAQYVVGITALGNEDYNPTIQGSGMGGRSQGRYEMRLTFQNTNVSTIKDVNGTALDGNGNGTPGGDFNFWFRTALPKPDVAPGQPRTLFVDKAGTNALTSGTLNAPYRTINYAFSQSLPGDIVRILPSRGVDGQIGTTGDNLAYEIGRGGSTNAVLSDGETFNVPRGVTVMIDAGTIFKLRGAKISVGSERIDEDRSLAALQVLGVPIFMDTNGALISGEVIFTSYQDESLAVDTNPLPTTPAAGNWAGIEFRNDFDYSEGRPVWETEGIFIDYVSQADIRYGGGSIAPTQPIVTPLQMLEARPTIIQNTIRFSSDAAISADPNSFAETNFHAPIYQRVAAFTSDYDRVGPHISGNRLVDNSINGLFVRVRTPAVGQREPMTVSGRFDDADITHVISEVLVLQGQPGGPLMLEQRPDVLSAAINPPTAPLPPTGMLTVGQTINYRVTFVTVEGTESLASLPTRSATVGTNANLRLTNLPQAPEGFAGRRLYRLDPASGDYVFVTQLDRNTTSYLDTGRTRGGILSVAALAQTSGERLLPRFDARLSIDPGLIIKLDSARIEAGIGADFYAEGTDGNPVVFTSRLDDEYGAGGTFDTNNDGSVGLPQPGDWGGLVFRQGSSASLDHIVIRYAGGSSAVSGGFANFNAVEILQSDVRIANSMLLDNAAGNLGELDFRDGIGFNGQGTIFIRGAQPVIVNNIIRDNLSAAISVNPDALNYREVQDRGRGTGKVDRFEGGRDNQGPLIAANLLDNNSINGMLVRNEALTTESVWDDTDIVHVVERFVYAWNHHHRSGLRLKSDPDQSLVVKLQDGGALVADRYLNDVEDSIGGTIQVIGQPGFPVILTSLNDDTVGAGFTPSGLPQNNTDNGTTAPRPGDWYGIVIRTGANDRNVAFVLETEPAIPEAAAFNAIPDTAQIIGSLARSEVSSDETRRLGFNIRGTLSLNSDIDVYSFLANGQTEVHLDIDDTHFGLDSIVELIDINGNILALSNSSYAEASDPNLLLSVNNIGPGAVLPLHKTAQRVVEGPNGLDAGMRVILPGNSNTVNQYFVRVRSSNLGPGDPASRLSQPGEVNNGRSSGQYQLSIRLRETDEIAGSTVRLADIRFATHAIDVPATPFDSPLAAEFAERLQANSLDVDGAGSFTNANAQLLGGLNESHRNVLRVSGFLGNNVADPASAAAGQDIDVYRVDLFHDRLVPEIIGQNRFVTAVFDIDYADQLARANTRLSIFDTDGRLILHGLNSNVADDQGRPRFGNDMGNLGAGSAGTLDSYIGPVELQEGTYYVVVSSAQMTPEVLNQYFNSGATDTNIRILPIDSVRRIAEFGFSENPVVVNGAPVVNSSETASLNQNAELPQLQPFFDHTSIVPYTLEDVKMFITLQGGLSGSNQTSVVTVDPFTGQLERTMGQFAQPSGDLAIRRDGELFSISHGPATGAQNNGNSGNYLNVSSATGASTNTGDDGLTFRQSNAAGTGTENANPDTAQFIVDAIAFQPIAANAGASAIGDVPNIPDTERVYVVGRRDNAGRGGEIPLALRTNIIYSLTGLDGAATNQGSTNADFDRNFGTAPYLESFGPGSNKQEFGIIDVGQFPDSNPTYTGGNITGLAQDPLEPSSGTGPGDSRFWAVTDNGGLYSFKLNNPTIGPSSFRTVDVDPLLPGSYNRVINTTFYGQVSRDPAHLGFGAPVFSSVTFGPRATEGRRYQNVLFATTTDGYIYTLRVDAQNRVQPAPVLVNGQSAVRIMTSFGTAAVTGASSVTGVAFSNREENPWHTTNDRNTPFAVGGPNSTNNLHGVFAPHNASRIRTSGATSLYFGFEPTGDANQNTLNDSTNGQLAPGGVHGSTVSRPFSLEGYGSGDKPTLYFNYFLEVEANDDYTLAPRAQVDSFRVFATGDDGQWRLLATNNAFRSFVNADEYDYFASNGGIPVQELHDDSNVWRQARVDLSPLAGNKNVQLRFDFSTAGGMQSQSVLQGFLTEIQAVPGTEVVNGTTFSLFDSGDFSIETFEFVRGVAINLPDGANLLNGQQISITRPVGPPINLTLTTGTPIGLSQIGFAVTDTAAEIAAAIALRLQTIAPDLMANSVDGQLLVPEANSSALNPARFGHVAIEIPPDMASLEGESVTFSNVSGLVTTVTLETAQRVQFTKGTSEVTVIANTSGAADGVFIRFVDNVQNLTATDIAAAATYNAALRVITVTYNSNPTFTSTNNDFDAITKAINDIDPRAFTAVLSAGDGSTRFTRILTGPNPDPVPVFSSTEVYFDPAIATPTTVAQAIGTKLNEIDPTLLTVVNGEQLILRGATNFALDAAFLAIANPISFNQGATDSQRLPSGNVPIFYNRTMTSTQVRDAIRASLANGLGEQNPISGVTQATLNTFPGYGTNRIRLFEQSLLTNTSEVGFSTFLPGDEFGAFGSTAIANNQVNPRPGQNNNVEGLYIDDIVVGFAERGEVVFNAPVNRDFVIDPTYRAVLTSDLHQPEFPDEILVGGYTLEVRSGANYGVPHDYDPIRLGLDEQLSWGRSFDINERFKPGAVTLNAPAGRALTDGQTFVISNGTRSVTFEFDSNGSVAPGHVRVPFVPVMTGANFNHLTDSPAEVARAIRDAINSPQARNLLAITAAGGDSIEVGPMSGNRVELFGDVIHINPSSGRFLLVDMVAAETPYGRESNRTIPRVDHENETVENVFMLDSFTRATTTNYLNNATQFFVSEVLTKPNLALATVTQYTNGQTDTLIAKGKIGDTVVTGMGNERIGSDPLQDVDVVKIFLNAGDTIDALVETNRFNRGAPFRTPRVQIFADDAGNTELADSLTFDPFDVTDPDNPFGFVNPIPFAELAIEARIDNFQAPASGYYYAAISSIARLLGVANPSELIGQYQLTVRPTGSGASDPLAIEYHLEKGDTNVFRGQGQLIIESNFISDFAGTGVRATYSGDQIPGQAAASRLELQPGGVAMLRNPNTDRLLPGTVISNNVITATAGTGILFSGITPTGGTAPAPVPFGRIVNNTVVGPGSGTGINVTNSTSPTVLNNVISGFNVGLNVAVNSNTTIENGNAFQANTTHSNRPLAAQSIVIPIGVAMFEDPARRLYIPAAGSLIIDSSFAALNDRATFFNTVKQPVGISASPIIAPVFDAYGIPRVDDPLVPTPGGVGSNVFIDRGGIDRADFVRPTAVLVSPIDFIAGKGEKVPFSDNDPDASFVRLPKGSSSVAFFEIQLLDPAGTGPDVATITQQTVILTEDGITLTPGVDYTFGYSDNSRLIRLTPLSGLWRPDSVYEITLNNQTRVSLELPAGDTIRDGDQYIVTDSTGTVGNESVFEFDSGYALQVPQTLGLTVLGPNTFFNDGDTFTITAPGGASSTFEINLIGAFTTGNIPINLAGAGTVEAIRDAIQAAISDPAVVAALDLAPRSLRRDSLQIGSLAGHSITGSVAGLAFIDDTADGVTSGERFRYVSGAVDRLFEFTFPGQTPIDPSAVAIEISRSSTIDEIGTAIATAIAAEPLGLNAARSIGDGRVLLGGSTTDVLTISNSSLEIIGSPGVTGALTLTVPLAANAGLLEGETFSVQNGAVSATFIFTTDPALPTTARRIILNLTATPAQIASAMAAEINAGFSGVLAPSTNQNVVTLGEQNAIIPSGTAQLRASVNVGTSPLVAAGVSGGAIAVPFLPTESFSPAAAAGTLASAIATSPLASMTFSPGGGTLLFSNTREILSRIAGGPVTPAGVASPALSDLATNPVAPNRDDGETRFTIIMPEVKFDFGDAPNSYSTLLASNGPRHSVSNNPPLFLGTVIDTENDGQPFPLSDDALVPVSASSPSGSTLFSFPPSVGFVDIVINNVAPTSGSSVLVTVGTASRTFEFVAVGVAPIENNIPLPLIAGESTDAIASRLADAIRSELGTVGSSLAVSIDPSTANVIRLQSQNDEDGIAIGTFTSTTGTTAGTSYRVFLAPGAPEVTTDPAHVLGFLNPQDPLGTNINVTVTGSGLLDAWIDFDDNGVFNSNEQVLRSTPVVDGVNTLKVLTPAGTSNKLTWARFRLSTGGNLRPTGVANGGEVEDYQIQIINIPLPTPNDDVLTVEEDNVLDLPLTEITDNDVVPIQTFLPVRVFVGIKPANGTLNIDAVTGRFTYTPDPAFFGTDSFTYRLSSQANAGDSTASAVTFATVTVNVTNTNEAPVFTAPASVDILEDAAPAVVPFATNVFPGPANAVGEIARQTVSFEILTELSPDPTGIMMRAPEIAPDGTLTAFPAPNAVGSVTYVFEAVDSDENDPTFVSARTRGSVVINVRPVNDPPQPNPVFVGQGQTQNADEAWSVDANGTITFTLKEDNTGALGVTSPYVMNLRRSAMPIGYERIGLLDAFAAGPPNELNATQGGSQTLRMIAFQATTVLGGTIRELARDPISNEITQLEYIPPTNLNSTIAGLDSFTFTVEDNNPLDGETFNVPDGILVENRRTSVATVQFRLNPVNDRPEFVIAGNTVSALEDSGNLTFEDFVTNIFAGPPDTAFDEVDLNSGQRVRFAVTAVSDVAGMFSAPPTINAAGALSFRTADDAYGMAVFEVRATDTGDDNATRGDIVSSSSRLITINIRPVNDRPTLSTTNPIVYALNEDSMIDNGDGTSSNFGTLIPLRGTGGQLGLLDVFNVGPANEAADITPGGKQSLTLSTPIPAGTVRGGILTRQFDDSGNLIGLRYTPRANFNGDDSFVYGVIDNGVSSDIDGNVTTDRREGFTTVTLRVLARNDAPTFGGAPSVTVLEDATTTPTIGQTIIPNWATNIQAGPAVGSDVLDSEANQRITFNVVAGAGNPAGLFTVAPTISENGTLSFTTSPDANGVAVFIVTASDNGGSNPPLDFNTSTPPRTFSITVSAVNDAPTFTPGANVTVNEDSGQFSSPTKYATNISPGPADEVRDGQTVRFEVTVPMSGRALFLNGNTTGSGLPTVSDDGFLRFTPADNVSGSVVVTVVAIDSAGARSIPASLTITIGEVNDVPVANNDTFSGNEDTVLVITPAQLLGNDVDPDLNSNPAEVLTIVDLPSMSLNGAVIRIGANGNIEYDPRNAVALQALAPGQIRSDTFTYRIQDAAFAKSNLATVTVNVAGINDAPVLLPDNPTLAPTGSTIIRPLDNDTDIDGTIDPASIRIELQPAFGSLRVEPDGTLVYTPFEGFRGQDSLRYSVADNLGLRSAPQTITIDINQAPVAVNDLDGTFRDEAVNINVAANDFDPDLSGSLDLNSVQIVTAPVRGTAVVAGGGIVRYLADSGFIGNDSFQYTIRDNNGRTSNVATVSVQTVGSRLQNPRLFTDVNASGETSPLDALLVINRISRGSQDGSSGSIPVLPTDVGPDFFDVDGNGFITPLDALRVINQIARDNQTRLVNGEGESAPTPQIRTSPVTATVADMVVMTFEDSDYQVDFDSPIDMVVKAIAMSIEDEKDTSASQMLAAIDAAWAEAGDL